MDFEIIPGFKWEKLGGAIHYQQKTSRLIVRLGIRLYPKLEQARQLEKYINMRQAEIKNELTEASFNARISTGIEYQYFWDLGCLKSSIFLQPVILQVDHA